MRRRNAAAVSAAAMAALAALAGTASAQDEAQGQAPATGGQGSATPAPAPASTTPAPASPAPAADPAAPTDLGSLEVEVDKVPPAAKKKSAEEQRRDGARRFLRQEAKTQGHADRADRDRPRGRPVRRPAVAAARAAAHRRPERRHRLAADPAVPAADLPGRRRRVRRALGGPRRDQRDRDRLRPQPERVAPPAPLGWMQFMPAHLGDLRRRRQRRRRKDPYNPVDAIFAAARYLRAAGADDGPAPGDLRLQPRRLVRQRRPRCAPARSPRCRADLVGSLTGLTQGRFPVDGDATLRRTPHAARRNAQGGRRRRRSRSPARAAAPASTSPPRDGAAGDRRPGRPRRRDRPQQAPRPLHPGPRRLRQHYTYGHLGEPQRAAPRAEGAPGRRGQRPPAGRTRTTRTRRRRSAGHGRQARHGRHEHRRARPPRSPRPPPPRRSPSRSACSPTRSARRSYAAGGQRQLSDAPDASAAQAVPRTRSASTSPSRYGLRRNDVALKPLRKGSRVIAGTILGRIGAVSHQWQPRRTCASRSARPARRRAAHRPDADPRRLEAARVDDALPRAGKNPLLGADATPTIGQILLMSKEALERRVLANPDIDIYACGRQDIRAGHRRPPRARDARVPRRERPEADRHARCAAATATYTASGNVSEHSSGDAIDIATINGIADPRPPGRGLDHRHRRAQAADAAGHDEAAPDHHADDSTPGTDNTFAMGDHDDHIHVGFQPAVRRQRRDRQGHRGRPAARPVEPPRSSRLGAIENPAVPLKPSRYAVKVKLKVRSER